MPMTAPMPPVHVNGEPVDQAPACCGVYRFLDRQDRALYIGKSVKLRARLRSHLAQARQRPRMQRLLHHCQRIDCAPTAGEIGALLIENAAIKAEAPPFNRRQRSIRGYWTLCTEPGADGFLRLCPTRVTAAEPSVSGHYGLYRSRHSALQRFMTRAREHGICLRAVGLEGGRGACFGAQIGHCRGACAGNEAPDSHNRRLLQLLARQQLVAWPFAPTIRIEEHCPDPAAGQPARQWHYVRNWVYLGTSDHPTLPAQAPPPFDRDSYRILLQALRRTDTRIQDADGRPLANPLVPATGP